MVGVPSAAHCPVPRSAAPLLEGVQGVVESVSSSLPGRPRERGGVPSQWAAQETPTGRLTFFGYPFPRPLRPGASHISVGLLPGVTKPSLFSRVGRDCSTGREGG